ncbi:MAG: hypothetical protein AB1505_16120 [Candidatus Latescibacterota bacterium]
MAIAAMVFAGVVILTAGPALLGLLIPLGAIAACIYGIHRLFGHLRFKAGLRDEAAVDTANGLEARVAELERRMTDVQDIVIALSDKYDLLEARAPQPQVTAQSLGQARHAE